MGMLKADFHSEAVEESERVLARAAMDLGSPITDPSLAGVSYCVRADMDGTRQRIRVVNAVGMVLGALGILIGFLVVAWHKHHKTLSPKDAVWAMGPVFLVASFLHHNASIRRLVNRRLHQATQASSTASLLVEIVWFGADMRGFNKNAAPILDDDVAVALCFPGFLQLESATHRYGIQRADLVYIVPDREMTRLSYRIGDAVFELNIKFTRSFSPGQYLHIKECLFDDP